MKILLLTPKQRDSFEQLLSEMDGLEWTGPTSDGTIVFTGDSVDGPQMGYINSDGTVEYLTCHHS